MPTPTVLISGAGIAGPALALCLSGHGYAVTVVERAASVRPGGQAVDFKGAVHHHVLEQMGILDDVYALQTPKTDLVIVDENDRPQATIPGEFLGGDVEILRGDLAALLYERTRNDVEYVFDDSVTALDESATGVDVRFAHGEPRTFDLVIGADGIHSAVRRLAFGPEEDYVTHLGYHYAVAGGSPGTGGGQGRARAYGYNEPGRLVWNGGQKAPQLYVFASGPLRYDRDDADAPKRIVRNAFAGMGWQTQRLLGELDDADCFLDSFGRVVMDRFTSGRVALVGDSAYGNTLGGFGTGLAIVGAYVLAGELALAGGDHRAAFARYDEVMRRYAKVARAVNAGPFLAPPSRWRMRMRNWTFRFSPLFLWMMRVTDRFATDIELRDYPAVGVDARTEDGRPGPVTS